MTDDQNDSYMISQIMELNRVYDLFQGAMVEGNRVLTETVDLIGKLYRMLGESVWVNEADHTLQRLIDPHQLICRYCGVYKMCEGKKQDHSDDCELKKLKSGGVSNDEIRTIQ